MWETAKMSYCTSGCLFMLRWNMMFLQKEYTIHLAVVSYMPPTPLGVGNIVKTECNLQMIYTSIVWFVFLTNISNVLSFLQGVLELCGPCTLSGLVTLKAVGRGRTVTPWVGWACGWEPTRLQLPPLLTDGMNQTTTLATSNCYDREQQLNRHNILAGINM